MAKKTYPLAEVYRLLEPGPVVMVTTARKGRRNVMTMSWHTLSARNYSFDALMATKECVLNIPTAVRAKKVTPPLIAECYASLECRVCDTRLVNKYNFFVLEVVKAWVDPSKENPRTLHHAGKGLFRVAGKTIKLPFRLK